MKLSRNGRVTVARTVWIAVAVFLLWRGLFPYFGRIDSGWAAAAALLAGLVVGYGKGRFVLRKSAARTTRFIARRPERDWIWMSLHPVLYLLIPVMIGLGLAVRKLAGPDHPAVVVALYVGIALALLIGATGFSAGRPEPEAA